jgi:hypothetical protein
MAVGNGAFEWGKWNCAWGQNVNMAARCVECVLYVKNCEHDDDGSSEVTTDMFIV